MTKYWTKGQGSLPRALRDDLERAGQGGAGRPDQGFYWVKPEVRHER